MNMADLLSSCFRKGVLLLLLLIIPSNLYAIHLSALYFSASKREVGVVLSADHYNVSLLTLRGEIVTLPRYEIIYMANYSLDVIPISRVSNSHVVKLVSVKTLQKKKIVNLVTGWPVDYTDVSISFLTLEGNEVAINRDSIWKIEFVDAPESIDFPIEINDKYEFVHPYPFQNSPKEYYGNTEPIEIRTIYPEQLLNDPVMIKGELDRISKGVEKIEKYEREQQFYPVPQVYGNKTILGYWISANSRYGASNSRTNNLAPILINEYSSGPFGYQHLFLTGSAPMPYSIHEEPQTQIYYKFKADYFHMAAMLDPGIFLLGSDKYEWRKSNFGRYDDRMNSSTAFEIGIDYGRFAVQFNVDSIMHGIYYQDKIYSEYTGSSRFGLTYRDHLFGCELQFENPFDGKKGEASDVYVYRFNLDLYFMKKLKTSYSAIFRRVERDVEKDDFYYRSRSFTNAVYLNYAISNKYQAGGFISAEYFANSYGEGHREGYEKVYPKIGINASLSF